MILDISSNALALIKILAVHLYLWMQNKKVEQKL